MKRTNADKAKLSGDKTDWLRILGTPQNVTDLISSRDTENPVLSGRKFVKSTKIAQR